MRLPEKFKTRMEILLKDEWQELLRAWEGPAYQGLRVNTLKIGAQTFQAKAPFSLEPVPWAPEGFYISGQERPAKHPYYQAGLFYLQEPSAMAPVVCLGIEPGDRVLDLCAAPGGKSTQIAARLKGRGMLVSNDNSPERVKTLVWNLEHWGAENVVVTNEEPGRLCDYFRHYFNKILVDAPCSGEGMFRKDERAVKSWEEYSSKNCSVMQKDILGQAAAMLCQGGKILYSTCTFSPEENEEIIAEFLDKYPEFTVEELPQDYGWAPGRPDWLGGQEAKKDELYKVRRLWPHKINGEGHFMALLKKNGAEKNAMEKNDNSVDILYVSDEKIPELLAFSEENLTESLKGPFYLQQNYVYQYPAGLPDLKGLRVPRPGWFVGINRNNRFEPSQALAMGLKRSAAIRSISFALGDPEVERYLKRETLMVGGEKGWTLVCLEDFPLGWGKQTGDYIKNYYPPRWRIME